jgi:hypothetical protein
VLKKCKTSAVERVRKAAGVALWNVGVRPKNASVKMKPKKKQRAKSENRGKDDSAAGPNGPPSDNDSMATSSSDGHVMISYDHQHKDVSLLYNMKSH